ncbi:hypothetical protein CIB95_03945 [Lottiidibacillus patelloidae]|uniref:Uncharacterized protein n=1 Tax=Lottiidibacillus patelloidae TaxID=2670334 RepID=A0A263BUV7_9BACI|nr:hypothetical protein [Lottiidibacillus patelloidae]OZM57531.1 hypothetical protein CIB95_03945 [Lottiidibacillus patelloidae]
MNFLQKSHLPFYAPIILFFPQLFLSFQAISKQEAVIVDWLLLVVAIIALLLSGLYVLKSTHNTPKMLGKIYIAVSVGSIIYTLIMVIN